MMIDILKYFKGKDRLENREKVLFRLVNELDRESYQLFNEIVDLSDISYYKIQNLYSRVKSLQVLYSETAESFDYIDEIENNSYDYAGKRFQLKRLLTAITTIYASMANALLGIVAFVVLNQKATDDFLRELNAINNRTDKFDEDQVKKIGSTIDNCTRMLESKITKMNEDGSLYSIINNNNLMVIQVNTFILSYIEGLISYDTINSLNDNFKCMIIEILQKDLNSESNDLFELLELAKKQNNDGLKLMKEYK